MTQLMPSPMNDLLVALARTVPIWDIAYLAGLVDGEGYLGAGNERAKSKGEGGDITPRVTISNNNYEVLGWARTLLGLGYIETRNGKGKRNTNYTLRLTGPKCEPFLRLLRPFLKVKVHQADLLIELVAIRRLSQGSRRYEPERQQVIKKELHELNRKFQPAIITTN